MSGRGAPCGAFPFVLSHSDLFVSLLREADCTLWGFLQTHKTAMVGNVLTPGGLLLRLTEFILPPPHPSVKEMDPRGAISYDQILFGI